MAETNQTHTEVGQTDGIEDGAGFPPFNPAHFGSQLLWLAITFGLFYLVIGRLAIPRIASILDARKVKIAADLEEASRFKAETDAAISAYEAALAAARQNAQAIAAETRAALTADVDAKRQAAEASLHQKLSAAEAEIEAVKVSALAEVSGIARETTQSVLAALSTASVSADEIAAAVATALAV